LAEFVPDVLSGILARIQAFSGLLGSGKIRRRPDACTMH